MAQLRRSLLSLKKFFFLLLSIRSKQKVNVLSKILSFLFADGCSRLLDLVRSRFFQDSCFVLRQDGSYTSCSCSNIWSPCRKGKREVCVCFSVRKEREREMIACSALCVLPLLLPPPLQCSCCRFQRITASMTAFSPRAQNASFSIRDDMCRC